MGHVRHNGMEEKVYFDLWIISKIIISFKREIIGHMHVHIQKIYKTEDERG